MNWRTKAACRHSDPDTWFPTPGDDTTRNRALRICRACPVQRECAEYAFHIDATEGIWGGLTPKQRTHLIGTPAHIRRARQGNQHYLRGATT